MKKWLYVFILLFSLLLTGCGQSEKKQISQNAEAAEEAEVEKPQQDGSEESEEMSDADRDARSNQSEEESHTTDSEGSIDEEKEVESSNWGGAWEIENSQLDGEILIYNETDEGFYFRIFVSSGHVGELDNVYAVKDGNVAVSERDEYGCEITMTKENGTISVLENADCLAWHGAGINFEHTFVLSESSLSEFVLDDKLLDLVEQGYLAEGTYPLGTKIKTIIEETGMYIGKDNISGADYYFFDTAAYGTLMLESADETEVVSLMVYRLANSYTPEEVISYLGEPAYQGEDQSNGFDFIMMYSLENDLNLVFQYAWGSTRLESVVLTDKGS